MLGIRQGELDLHGRPRNITWTRLSATAIATDTMLHVQDRVDWVAGDKIVIAPTGKEGNETEVGFLYRGTCMIPSHTRQSQEASLTNIEFVDSHS